MVTTIRLTLRLLIMVRFSKWTYICIALFVMTVCFCACDKTQDVDYFGQWELKVAYVTNEKDASRQDTIKAERRYMCIQGEIVYLMASGDGYGHYTQRGDSLFIVFYQDGGQRDCKYTADQFGFYHYKDVRVRVDHHDSDGLVLSKGKDRWYFERVF